MQGHARGDPGIYIGISALRRMTAAAETALAAGGYKDAAT